MSLLAKVTPAAEPFVIVTVSKGLEPEVTDWAPVPLKSTVLVLRVNVAEFNQSPATVIVLEDAARVPVDIVTLLTLAAPLNDSRVRAPPAGRSHRLPRPA